MPFVLEPEDDPDSGQFKKWPNQSKVHLESR